MEANCPICNAPFSRVEMVLAEREKNFQCRRCWTSVHHVAPVGAHVASPKKDRVDRHGGPSHDTKRRAA